MPIKLHQAEQRVLLVSRQATIGDILRQLPTNRAERLATFVVLIDQPDHYIVAQWAEIEELARFFGDVSPSLPLIQLDGLNPPTTGIEVMKTDDDAARTQARSAPGQRLVALQNGQVIGIVLGLPSAFNIDENTDDPFESISKSLPSRSTREVYPPESAPQQHQQQMPPRPNVLGLEDASSSDDASFGVDTSIEESAPAAEPNDPRVINAWVTDMDGERMAGRPLELDNTYELKFNVDKPVKGAEGTAEINVAKLFQALPAEQQTIEIQVLIESDDFIIHGSDQLPIVVPRTGRSKNTATFNIEPKHNGPSVIRAFFVANNRIFQKMNLTLQVGPIDAETPAVEVETRGMTLASTLNLVTTRTEHPISLVIIKKEAGYQFILQGGVTMRAFLNLSETQIAELVAQTRDMFKSIVYTISNGQYVYQLDDTHIPPEIHANTLKVMARHGSLMFRKLFYGPGSGPDARAMGDLLRQLSLTHQLRIEIVTERFVFHWSMLYDRADLKPDLSNIDPEGFWGFRHHIEYKPEFSNPSLVHFVPQIPVKDKLAMHFVSNTTIDEQMKRPIVAGQREFLNTVNAITVREHSTVNELYTLLTDSEQANQLIYFYCHAVSNLPGEKGGVGGSKIVLSDQAVTLDDLNFAAPLDMPPLPGAPLVFLNCCQSAELSPYLYDGLVPYLITRGARGVVGTEVDTPALFAAEFAKLFIQRFVVGGERLGDVLLALRREYLYQRQNVMGLVYSLYSSGDVQVVR